jgi:hypothetical protein
MILQVIENIFQSYWSWVIVGGVILLFIPICFILNKKKKPKSYTIKASDAPLTVDETYTCSADNGLKPGTYQIVPSDTQVHEIGIRLGGYVRTYAVDALISLKAGDDISPVSQNIYLRRLK